MSNATYEEVKALDPASLANALYARDFSSATDATVATTLVANLGLTAVAGLTNWVAAQLTAAGSAKGAKIVDLLNGFAQLAADATYGAAATAFNTKVDASLALSQTAGNAGGTFDDISTAVAGRTFTLTTGLDRGTAFTGTSGDDTFVGLDSATDDNDTIGVGDSINGGGGNDTLQIVTGDTDAGIMTVANIENVDIYASTTATVDAVRWSGVETLTLIDSSIPNAGTVTVNNLKNNVALSLQNVTMTTNGDDALTVEFDAGAVGAAGTLAIDVNGVGSSTLRGDIAVTANTNVFTGITIASSGTLSNIGLAAGAADDVVATTLTITNSTTLTVVEATNVDFSDINNVDLSGNTGTLTITGQLGDEDDFELTGGSGAETVTVDIGDAVTIDMGAGNDTVLLTNATAATLTSGDTINGGAGTNTLGLTSANAADIAADTILLDQITNFGRLRITDNLDDDIDASDFGVNYVQLADDVANAQTISGLSSGATIEYRDTADGTADLTVEITDATRAGRNSDVLNISLNANLVNNSSVDHDIVITGVDTVNITANDSSNADAATTFDDGYVLDLLGTGNLNNITVAGSSLVSLTLTNAADQLESIDGSASTGQLTINIDALDGGDGVAVKGGSRADTITGSDYDDTIEGNGGNDTITGGDGDDLLTGGAGADTFVFGATAAANGQDEITDFDVSEDLLSFIAQLTTFAAADFVALNTADDATGDVVLDDDHVYVIDFDGDIADLDFGGTDFADLFGTAVYLAVDDNSAEAIVIVQGDDETHVYHVADGGANYDADDVALVAIIGITNTNTITVDNLVEA